MTEQQSKDHKMITDAWHLLRDYGNLTTSESDSARWEALINDADIMAAESQEARKVAGMIINMIECRARGWQINT